MIGGWIEFVYSKRLTLIHYPVYNTMI